MARCALLPAGRKRRRFAGLRELARAGGVVRLLFGSIDLMFDLDAQDDGEALHYFRSRLVLHSRAAGLPAPVDGVCTAIGDDAALAAETRRARAFGFGAKLLIHPRQVRGVHDGLAPSADERHWAGRVMAAAAAADGAAVAVDGKMVDRPVLERARGSCPALVHRRQSSRLPAVSGTIASPTSEIRPQPITYSAGALALPVSSISQVAISWAKPPNTSTPMQ